MTSVEKMDALDLIIATLKEHEQVLDDLAYRIEESLGGKPVERYPSHVVDSRLEDMR